MKENKMGYERIPKLLMKMSLPIALSMLVQALYNIVDSIWVSRIGEDALAAVSMAFPIQMLINAFSVGVGVGMNALLSRYLGERDARNANLTAQHGAVLTLINALIFAVLGLTVASKLIGMQTSDPAILADGTRYLSICFIFSIGLCGQIYMERLLQSTGLAIYSMYTQVFGAVLNIILDPILIFGLGPFPRMDVSGAAVATVASQIMALIFGLILNLKKNKELDLFQDGFHINESIVRGIFAVGIPSIIMMSVNSFSIFVINTMLAAFGSVAVVALGIYFKVQSFVFMPVFGLNNGLIPIIAYNYGARHQDRIYEVIKLAYKVAIIFMAIGFLAFQIFAKQIIGFFDPSPELLSVGMVSLRIISISFVFAAVNLISSAVFQSFGNGTLSMVVNLVRQLIFIIPLVYIFSKMGNLSLVWFSYPIAEVLTVFIAVYFMKKIDDTTIKPLANIPE
ncbi:MAG: MATE family efflux transporter [Peptoniphilus sp.]|nr:MATE family efflux transporter [Peptoniphilus sp.]MDY6045138.1 MATE family efflux transporter [Peptoniphilus sp.]